MDEPYTQAELEAGAEASWANAWDGVPPDLQPSSPPWPEFAAANQENADYFRRKAAHVLRAVLPDHDTRVRAEVAEEIARALAQEYCTLVATGLAVAATPYGHAAEIARAHATPQEEPRA